MSPRAETRSGGASKPKTKTAAHTHYVMDLFYPERPGSDRFRRDVLRFEAHDVEAALAEGRRIDSWRKSSFYRIRQITSSARSGDVVIYDSEPQSAVSVPDTMADTAPAELASVDDGEAVNAAAPAGPAAEEKVS